MGLLEGAAQDRCLPVALDGDHQVAPVDACQGTRHVGGRAGAVVDGMAPKFEPGAQGAGRGESQPLRQDDDAGGGVQQLDEAIGSLEREIAADLIDERAGLVERAHSRFLR